MHYFIRRPWDLPQRDHTPPEVYRARREHRREFLKVMGTAAVGTGLASLLGGCSQPQPEEIEQAGAVKELDDGFSATYPAKRTPEFEYGRPETAQTAAARYTNFYEFTPGKNSWRYVSKFNPVPWKINVDGLCAKPQTFDLDDIYNTFSLEERAYRHRCVETWAMCVPWTGFPLRDLLRRVEPQPEAKYVAFETFHRPAEAPAMKHSPDYPWPYAEGLTLDEAVNEMTFLATGIYGEPLPKQHGAPVRLAVPWKYGFKSIKSIVKITLTDQRPSTFWNTLAAHEYGFEANVNPDVPHPRWSQRTEWMLGTYEEYPTDLYNGYGEYVGKLYRG